MHGIAWQAHHIQKIIRNNPSPPGCLDQSVQHKQIKKYLSFAGREVPLFNIGVMAFKNEAIDQVSLTSGIIVNKHNIFFLGGSNPNVFTLPCPWPNPDLWMIAAVTHSPSNGSWVVWMLYGIVHPKWWPYMHTSFFCKIIFHQHIKEITMT